MSNGSPFIVRSTTIAAQADARAIVQAAEEDSRRMRAALEEETAAVLAEARREGLREGLERAAAITTQASQAVQTFWHERETELRDVALAVAHRVLSSLPVDETIVRLASEAIAEHANDSRLELRAAPDVAELLRSALRDRPSGGQVVIVADPTSPSDACVLLHPRGRSELGLLAQFRSLMKSSDMSGERPAS